jgi:hypothetical protein
MKDFEGSWPGHEVGTARLLYRLGGQILNLRNSDAARQGILAELKTI